MNNNMKHIEIMKHDEIKHADDADFRDLYRFACGADATAGTKSPKGFNMDNTLQATGAARGIRRNDIPCLTRRDARPCVSIVCVVHCRRSLTCGYENFVLSGRLGADGTSGTFGTAGTSETFGSQSPKDFNMDNSLQTAATSVARGNEDYWHIDDADFRDLHRFYIVRHFQFSIFN
jgi:hypothetical protein